MSVIAAKVYDKEVIMAADSILVKGSSKRNSNFTKILKLNDMIMGSTGSAEEVSFMWHYMETHKPASATEKDILDFFAEFSQWKANKGGRNYPIRIHSANPIGVQNMRAIIERNGWEEVK